MKIPLLLSVVLLLPMFFPLPPKLGLKSKFYGISNEKFDEPCKNRIQKKINNSFYYIKICHIPLKNNTYAFLCIFLCLLICHILL